jgi:hypothetical protein
MSDHVVSPANAAEIYGAADYQAEVNAAEDAALQASAAWSAALEIEGNGLASAATDRMIRAQLAYGAALDLATTDAAAAAAYTAYAEATVTAYLSSNYSAEQIALAADASVQAMVHGTAEVVDTSSTQLAALVAIATSESIDAQMSIIADDADWSAVFEAGTTLRASIAAATDTTAVVRAFATYQGAVASTIATQADLGTSLVVELGASVDAAATALMAQLAAAAPAHHRRPVRDQRARDAPRAGRPRGRDPLIG